MTDQERREKFERYRKEKFKRVPLDMQKTDYERLKVHAVVAGVPVNRYIKEAIEERIANDDKKLGITPDTQIKVNEDGSISFYRRF